MIFITRKGFGLLFLRSIVECIGTMHHCILIAHHILHHFIWISSFVWTQSWSMCKNRHLKSSHTKDPDHAHRMPLRRKRNPAPFRWKSKSTDAFFKCRCNLMNVNEKRWWLCRGQSKCNHLTWKTFMKTQKERNDWVFSWYDHLSAFFYSRAMWKKSDNNICIETYNFILLNEPFHMEISCRMKLQMFKEQERKTISFIIEMQINFFSFHIFPRKERIM